MVSTSAQVQFEHGLSATLRMMNSGKPLPEVLQFIAVQASEMMGGKTAVSIHRFNHDKQLFMLETAYLLPAAVPAMAEILPPSVPSPITTWREPLIVPQKDSPHVAAVPLVVQDTLIGAMAFYFPQKQAISAASVNLAATFGEQTALAFEYARLHEAGQTRQRELQTLLDVTEATSSSLHLEETLDAAINRLLKLVESERIGVIIYDDAQKEYILRKVYPPRRLSEAEWNQLMPIGQQVVTQGKPISFAPHSAPGVEDEPVAFVPIGAHGQTFGVLGIVGHPKRPFTPQQLLLLDSVGTLLGGAVEHARLVEQAEAAAVVQERNRLARELHDAVTQTLFSASLIADVLPRIWEKDAAQGEARLGELKELTRGALAEMRTLLLELRPATLTESSLGELLRQLTDAVVGRSRMLIELTVAGGERPLPPDTQVALYRIAQESLNNIVKHARASQMTVSVQFAAEWIKLCVQDDGCGFDWQALKDNPLGISLGLGIMQERAEKIGATLTIETFVGGGTTICVLCPLRSET